MSVRRRRTISVLLLLTGYSALILGTLGLAVRPLIGALAVLGGMALLICSAVELIEDKPAPGSRPEGG